jgi:NAD(P)-dependent dehydrogenase (short-subunit alcohol dehydrogenase family)
MADQALQALPAEDRDRALSGFASLHPMNRMGTVSEIASAVILLCSDRASFVTGQILNVDGGWTAK